MCPTVEPSLRQSSCQLAACVVAVYKVVKHFGKIYSKRIARCLCPAKLRATFFKFRSPMGVDVAIGLAKHFTLPPRSALSWARKASRTTHDLYPVASCRFNGGSRLLDACSLSSNLNSGVHNDFVLIPWNHQCGAEPIRHALRLVGSRRSAARLHLRRQQRCDSASVLIVCRPNPNQSDSRMEYFELIVCPSQSSDCLTPTKSSSVRLRCGRARGLPNQHYSQYRRLSFANFFANSHGVL